MLFNTVKVLVRGSEKDLKALSEKTIEEFGLSISSQEVLDPKGNLWCVTAFDLPMMKPICITRPDGEELEVNVKSYRLRLLGDYLGSYESLWYSIPEFLGALEQHFKDLEIDSTID